MILECVSTNSFVSLYLNSKASVNECKMSKAGLTLGIWLVLVHASCATVCNDRVLSALNREETARCQQIVEMFETALISEEINSFSLREKFFPSNDNPSPFLVVLTKIHISVPHHETKTYVDRRHWCKNSAFQLIDPLQLEAMFPMLEDIINKGIDICRHYVDPVYLVLNINDTLNLTKKRDLLCYGLHYTMGELQQVSQIYNYIYNYIHMHACT